MKEKEIRERVEQFLKRTARNVVVPASLGLGLSLSGCEGNALRAGAADAGEIQIRLGLRLGGLCRSPIEGTDGNVEFFILLSVGRSSESLDVGKEI